MNEPLQGMIGPTEGIEVLEYRVYLCDIKFVKNRSIITVSNS